ncbi:baseplate J/gp47 family protein [Pseudoflavonifractor sp. 524-17]|uniref:baseplate J/gp47 family protein n=1 Tax=Pseudoflavonifractor sp. 524-17 TaxID=2304577 RepID=UPI00137B8777|nr:baseplate J/gp47 family protein [Pseudoflavonifractor sp. 524-17]
MRNAEYQFVPTDTSTVEALLVALYEQLTKTSISPASPERQLIQWAANVIVQERVLSNYAANQNIPSRAEGENLDALAELFLARARPAAKAAVCQMRFTISEAQATAILIPAGTRVTGAGGALTWETVEDVYVPIGETSAEVQARCQTAGTAGNGYAAGQINTLVDLYDYYSECANITQSDGGADAATDDEFYELLHSSMDAYSCAGARGSYEYFAKQVSTEIADVVANSPTPGVVKLYVLMDGGELAGEEIKKAVLAACSADDVRPLTDQVFVEDAELVGYDVSFTYYTQSGSGKSAADIQAAVEAAVERYNAWQCAKLGRDINPSHLIGLLMQTGIKRVELRAPAFTVLRDGGGTKGAPAGEKEEGTGQSGALAESRSEAGGVASDVPQVARAGTVTITNGGYEDE